MSNATCIFKKVFLQHQAKKGSSHNYWEMPLILQSGLRTPEKVSNCAKMKFNVSYHRQINILRGQLLLALKW